MVVQRCVSPQVLLLPAVLLPIGTCPVLQSNAAAGSVLSPPCLDPCGTPRCIPALQSGTWMPTPWSCSSASSLPTRRSRGVSPALILPLGRPSCRLRSCRACLRDHPRWLPSPCRRCNGHPAAPHREPAVQALQPARRGHLPQQQDGLLKVVHSVPGMTWYHSQHGSCQSVAAGLRAMCCMLA